MIREATKAEQDAINKANDLLKPVKLTITQLTDGNATVTPRNTP
jgi:hypothetical protein